MREDKYRGDIGEIPPIAETLGVGMLAQNLKAIDPKINSPWTSS